MLEGLVITNNSERNQGLGHDRAVTGFHGIAANGWFSGTLVKVPEL